MARLYTACWTMSETNLGAASVGERGVSLENVAIAADTQLKILGRTTGVGAFTRMLVVPEYYFNAGGNIASRDDKHVIYRRLENISASVPDMLLIAGTIAYQKGVFSKDTYNVCPILLGGAIIKKLYKSNDDGVYQINGTFKTKEDDGKGVPLVTV